MDATQIRELTDDEIEERIAETRQEMASLRFRRSYEELDNPLTLRTLRRDIARLKTILHERHRAANEDERDG